jgi:hypothetical protein
MQEPGITLGGPSNLEGASACKDHMPVAPILGHAKTTGRRRIALRERRQTEYSDKQYSTHEAAFKSRMPKHYHATLLCLVSRQHLFFPTFKEALKKS